MSRRVPSLPSGRIGGACRGTDRESRVDGFSRGRRRWRRDIAPSDAWRWRQYLTPWRSAVGLNPAVRMTLGARTESRMNCPRNGLRPAWLRSLLYGPRMTRSSRRSGHRRTGIWAPSRRHEGLLVAALGLAIALAACGPVSPSGLAAASAPAAGSLDTPTPASPTPASPTAAPTVAPGTSPAATRVRVARSDIQLPAARSRAVARVFGSMILLCGGLTSNGTTTGSIFGIDLPSGRISKVGALAAPVHDAGGAVLDGSGFVVGGGQLGPGSAVQRVGPTGATTTVGQLPALRADLAAVAADGELVV